MEGSTMSKRKEVPKSSKNDRGRGFSAQLDAIIFNEIFRV